MLMFFSVAWVTAVHHSILALLGKILNQAKRIFPAIPVFVIMLHQIEMEEADE